MGKSAWTEQDPILEQLLPDATSESLEHARRWTAFLRGLVGEAAPELDPEQVRDELGRRERVRVLDALFSLLASYWNASLSADSFLDAGDAGVEFGEAWDRLSAARQDRSIPASALPTFPEPNEPLPSVMGRLLECATHLGASEADVLLWTRRLSGPDPAGRTHQELKRLGAAPALLDLAAADTAAALLDQGLPLEAERFLDRLDPALGPSGRAATLLSWSRSLLGSTDRSLFVGAAGSVPTPIGELRDACPELLPFFAGSAVSGREFRHPGMGAPRTRGEVGASLVAWIRFDGRRASVEHLDAAPGLDTQALIRRREPWVKRGTPEHELVLSAEPVVRRDPGGIDPRARAVVLVPVLEADGELTGWIHLEFAHHLAPSLDRLRAWGQGLAGRWRPGHEDREPDTGGEEYEVAANTFAECAQAIGSKTTHRRWRGFLLEQGEPVLVATGGGGLLPEGFTPGRGRALWRALTSGGVALFEDLDPALSLDARAASGLVVPIRHEGRVVGALSLESARRRDFKSKDAERIGAALESFALALRLAAFDAWHRRRFGHGLGFAPGDDAQVERQARLALAARAAAPAVVIGPAGSGRRTLARQIHFEASGGDRPLVEVAAEKLPELELPTGDVTLLVHGLERLDSAGAECLELWSERRQLRILLTSTLAPKSLVAEGVLETRLGGRLSRLPVEAAPLADRRAELPAILQALVLRFAEEEDLEPVALRDDAVGLLWRQPWKDGIGELANTVYRLALDHGGESIDADQVRATLEAYGDELLRRLPSRHPRELDLRAALELTRKDTGRLNKTRASMYLGWDPDTLVARMRDLGLED